MGTNIEKRIDADVIVSAPSTVDDATVSASPQSEKVHEEINALTGDFPDGGLRAWLVICGVSVSRIETDFPTMYSD